MKIRRLGFTLFEILIAVALLVVLSVVLLRVFVLFADFWTAGDEQARLYADAKTALAILSEDLENAVYDTKSVTSNTGNAAPMFLEAYRPASSSDNLPIFNTISRYKKDSTIYWPWLHLVTRTSWEMDRDGHGHPAMSELCKVSYLFSPPTTGADRTEIGNSFSADGELLRVCQGDFYCNMKADWSGGRSMAVYFPITSTSIRRFGQTVVKGVLNFQVLAYRNAAGNDRYKAVAPFVVDTGDRISRKRNNLEIDDTTTSSQTLTEGMKNVNRIQIVLTLMPPARLANLRTLDEDEQQEYIHKYARTFRKTIRIKEMAQ